MIGIRAGNEDGDEIFGFFGLRCHFLELGLMGLRGGGALGENERRRRARKHVQRGLIIDFVACLWEECISAGGVRKLAKAGPFVCITLKTVWHLDYVFICTFMNA